MLIKSIELTNFRNYKNQKIEFNNKGKEGGSSGGLIYTLAIYNKLTDYDLTKGRITWRAK